MNTQRVPGQQISGLSGPVTCKDALPEAAFPAVTCNQDCVRLLAYLEVVFVIWKYRRM